MVLVSFKQMLVQDSKLCPKYQNHRGFNLSPDLQIKQLNNNNKSYKMGSCLSDPANISPKHRHKNIYNPIQEIIDKFSIERLNDLWDRNQLKVIESKVSTLVNISITFDRFLEIFPKILNFSLQTQKKYYRLFAFQGNKEISKKELIQSLTIIKKVAENKHLAPLIFYVYTKELKHRFMSEEQLKLFEEENKAYAKNLENIDDELSGIQEVEEENVSPTHVITQQKVNGKDLQVVSSQTNEKTVEGQGELQTLNNSKLITLPKFMEIFENYNLQSYQILFSWNLAEQERELVEYLSKEGINRKKGDTVYLIEYQWFLAWKLYAEREYQTKIQYRQDECELNYASYRSVNRKRSNSQSKITNEVVKVEKPGEIKNYVLKYGKKDNELHQNLVEFYNYLCVKEQIWNKLVAIYNGGPAIERIYPKIYYNVIIKVSVNERGRFVCKSTKKIESRERPTVSGYASMQELKYACYYKYPGKKNWFNLKNTSTSSQQIFNGPRTYLTFVPKNAEGLFTDYYNINQVKDAKILKERFKNYGTQINFSIDGVLNRAQVIEIEDDFHVTIEYIDQNGNNHKKTIEYDENFQKFNPENLSKENQINQLSGLDNIGNTCYMNAVIQCLIRTPFFGSYLEQQNFADNNEKDELLIEEISKIYMKSKTNNHESINTKPFKKVFEKHCPYFEGNSQHDAQEFLICLLERLMEEIKIKRVQYGVRSEIKPEKPTEQQNNKNKKVVKFFSGKTEAVTTCQKCNNKGVRIESFFTYSLSLPEQPVIEFFYHYVPFYRDETNKSAIPLHCGITLNRKVTVEQFLDFVTKQRKLKKYKLALYTVFNNQILNKLQQNSYHKQISYYLHFNAKLVCYQIQHEETPTYYDYQRKRLNNKSIKIQLRQRIYSQKNQEYKVFYQPFILEITENMYWKDVVEDIQTILQKLSSPKESIILESRLPSNHPSQEVGISEIKLSTTTVKHSSSMNDSPNQIFSKNAQSLIKPNRHTVNQSQITHKTVNSSSSQSYKIRVIKSDHLYENNCIFCKEEFVSKKRSFSKRVCKDCSFDPNSLLFEQSEFRNICDNIIITVDWQKYIPEYEKWVKDPSYDICIQKSQNRKDRLEELLINNINLSEQLELRCERETCQFNFANRTEKISIYPNILLLHLKRFTYEDNMLVKLTNSVFYPQIIQFPSAKTERYELYGVVSHMGSGVGGHYISFVKVASKWYKCDDNRVTFCNPNQQIDPNAYLLFYRKIDFEPSLITLSF